MSKNWLVLILIGILILPMVMSECNEQVIINELATAKKDIVDKVNANTDESFSSYDKFVREQMNRWILSVDSTMKKGAITGVIALLGVASLTSALWGLLHTKKLRLFLTIQNERIQEINDKLNAFIMVKGSKPSDIEKIMKQLQQSQYQPQPQPIMTPEPKKEKRGLFGRKKSDTSVSHRTPSEQIQQRQSTGFTYNK
jgi:hypothetical protein